MTCIAGVESDGVVCIGGDSAGIGGELVDIRADEKVFHRNGYIMGFTTSFRMGQILHYVGEDPPKPSVNAKLDKFMVTKFVDWVRAVLAEGGWKRTDSEQESGGSFLVGVRGTLYLIDPDFQAGRSQNGYLAVGCGEGIALGSLFSTADLEPHERVVLALEAAVHHSTGVRGPFVVEEL